MENPREVLKRHGLEPRRSLGQNFLVHPTAPARIAAGADVGPEDTVLEVGAGVGTLTGALAARAGRVIAVETDEKLVEVLRQELRGMENVEVVHGDILELDPVDLLDVHRDLVGSHLWGELLTNYVVVANLPYYITAPVIRHLLEARVRPQRMVLTVQKEVAQRISAGPGDRGLLSVSVQFYGKPKILFRLNRGAFYPVPRVDSAVLRVDLYQDPPVEVPGVELFFAVARAGFAQRRKQLHNTISATLHLDSQRVHDAISGAGLDPRRRAQTLTLEEWGRVTRALAPLIRSSN
jgi:16S rRNA (adenine1518-N6/adenine1519-N6)-dimethyltransferase